MTMTNRTSEVRQEELFLSARTARTRNSVLWAAYGDALGFISELVSDKGLKQRTRGAALDRLMAWERRVGGRGGVAARLPAGCWSDDTQLRMAVSRTITSHGFDVEAFARIELPVWPSYALGGGRASKAAAKNLGKPNVLWYANTFPRWFEAGGNGAAMRIQPHVWSSPDHDRKYLYLTDVITDSVCTHGHLRAIVGACFHAATLAHCLRVGSVPDLNKCAEIALRIGEAFQLIENHQFLASLWIGLWEKETGKKLREEWNATVSELRTAIEQAAADADEAGNTAVAYRGISDRLGLEAAHQRGSGILTTVAAVALAAIAPNAHEGVVVASNAVGTDTDTIATMAGALLGACHGTGAPPEEVLDRVYLLAEADRLVHISQGREVANHSYPDPLTWTAPRTQADALVSDNAQLVVEGLGSVVETDESQSWTPSKDFGWQWVRTDFGQTLLIKRRPEVRSLGAGNSIAPPPPIDASRSRRATKPGSQTLDVRPAAPLDRPLNIDRALDYARQHINDDRELGYTVREVARRGTLTDLAVLVTALREYLRPTDQTSTPPKDRRSTMYKIGQKPGRGRYCCVACSWSVYLDDNSDRLPPCGSCGKGQNTLYVSC